MKYIEVAVAAPIDYTLTYLLPEEQAADELQPGQRLLVPLGSRLVTGYLLGAGDEPEDTSKVKAIAEVLDPAPLFPTEIIPFFRWLARYYHYPPGMVIKCALPGGLTVQSGWRAVLTEAGRSRLAQDSEMISGASSPPVWLAKLLERGELTPAAVADIRRRGQGEVLERWQEQGLVEINQELVDQKVKARTELRAALTEAGWHLASGGDIEDALKPSEYKTIALLAEMAGDLETGGIERSVACHELSRHYPAARQALKGLAARQLVTLAEYPVYRDPFGEPHLSYGEPRSLTAEQAAALTQLMPAVEQRQYAPFLLHGVTGSGKTEIYLQAAAATLKIGRSVLVLVPEIALATQLEGHFLSRFGNQVALLHSGLTPGELFDQWQRIMRGEARVVIGARSAVFAPLDDIGLVVVDEEHDPAYKQEDGLRYHGRDAAVMRASLLRATVILGSATPSATSFYHTSTGKYRLLTLKNRVAERPLPAVRIIDLRRIRPASGPPPIFSPELAAALEENLKAGLQSLVFLNRRGYANLVICSACGSSLQCRNCQVSLTLHRGRRELLCHYCGYSLPGNVLCGHCGTGRLLEIGFGTERLEHELAKLLPAARIRRLDRDTCTRRRDYLGVLKAMHKQELDILIGTQMIAKGHHFPKVTLVGIVWADAGLGMPDFRAGERTFQLLSQVTGRAGRGETAGRVIIQTLQPEHYSITLAQEHDYSGLFHQEIGFRQELGFPPFSRLINLRIEGNNEDTVREVAIGLARLARDLQRGRLSISILGPAPAPLARLRGKFRWQLLLKAGELEPLHQLASALQQRAAGLAKGRPVRVTLDVDPENML